MQPGACRSLGAHYPERAVYVASGEIEVDGNRPPTGRMVVLPPGQAAQINAIQASTVMLLGGEPVGERYLSWNFVSSSKERLAHARADWQAQRMQLPVGDDHEFMPLPEGIG